MSPALLDVAMCPAKKLHDPASLSPCFYQPTVFAIWLDFPTTRCCGEWKLHAKGGGKKKDGRNLKC